MRGTKFKNFCSSSLWTCLHHMVILRSQSKITDFLMILAWASPFKYILGLPLLAKSCMASDPAHWDACVYYVIQIDTVTSYSHKGAGL